MAKATPPESEIFRLVKKKHRQKKSEHLHFVRWAKMGICSPIASLLLLFEAYLKSYNCSNVAGCFRRSGVPRALWCPAVPSTNAGKDTWIFGPLGSSTVWLVGLLCTDLMTYQDPSSLVQ